MNQKERLIEVLKLPSNCMPNAKCESCGLNGGCSVQRQADKILADGWFRPPVKVGDVVYAISNNKIYKTKVFSLVAETEDEKWVYILKCNIFEGISMFKKFLFGKTVFTSREDAEKALRGGEDNG